MASMLETLKPPDALARRISRAEGRLERMIRGGSSWDSARHWLSGLWPGGRSSWTGSSLGASLGSWAPAWPNGWTSRSGDRWSDTTDRVGSTTRAIADELMRLGADAASAPRHRTTHHRPIGKVVLVAAGLGLLAALARRE
jgi:hypothetical protein